MYKGNTQVELRRPQKSLFDLSHEKKLSTRMGRLTPVLCLEAIPGDKFTGTTEALVRLAPLLAPIYESLIMYVHFFFVPNRLLWAEWEEMITGGRLGVGVDPVTAPIPPYFTFLGGAQGDLVESSLLDYLGLPVVDPESPAWDGLSFDALPVLAYQKIWDDYYRDRNYYADNYLEVQLPAPSGELVNTGGANRMTAIRTRDWMKEYFTAALPFTQRGTEVLMPLAGTGSVTYLEPSEVWPDPYTAPSALAGDLLNDTGEVRESASNLGVQIRNIDEVSLDSSSVSINDLRSAVRLQEWLERNAVGGSRYVESIQAHFAVRPQDSRLQRAEFLGGGRIPIKISEVVTTAYSTNAAEQTIPAANLQGHGVSFGNTNRFRYFAPEHGFIYGILSIMVKPSYYQGMPRMFKRPTFLDYPWPTFAKLGEQEVHKWELQADAPNLTQDVDGSYPLFGYVSRYADWKQCHNTLHGAFRSTLKFWTMVREIDAESPVELGAEFVNFDDNVQNAPFVVNGTADNFWLYVHNDVKVVRALPYFGTPTL